MLSKQSSKWPVGSGQSARFCFLFFIYGFSILFISFKSGKPSLATKYTSVTKIPLDGGFFTTDNLQNIYVVRGSSVRKFNSQGKELFNYSDKSYGRITSIDVNDPLKVLVFHRDFPEIILLDNTLSQNGNPFSPADAGYPLATLACTSHDNGIWLYDAQNFQLIRLDVNLSVVQQTGNIAQSVGIPLNPDYIMEYNNFVYLNDSAQGLLVFDSYGTYYKTIPIVGLNTFQIRGDDMFYVAKNRIHTFHLKTIMEDVTMAPDTLATEVRIEKNLLFEKYKDTVRVFDVKSEKER